MPWVSTVTPYQPWYLARTPPPNPHKNPSPTSGPGISSGAWRTSSGCSPTCGARSENNQVLGGPVAQRRRREGLERRASPRSSSSQGYRIVDPGRYQGGEGQLPPPRSSSSRTSRPTSSPGCRCPRTSPPSGSRRPSGTSSPGWPRSARPCCSRRSSRPWAGQPASAPRSGGAPGTPFSSSLTGASALELAEDYQARTGRQWIQPTASCTPCSRWRQSVLKQVGDVADRQALAERHQGDQHEHDRRQGRLDPHPGRLPQRVSGPRWSGAGGAEGTDLAVRAGDRLQHRPPRGSRLPARCSRSP